MDFAILQEALSLIVVFGLVTMVCAFLLVYAKVNLWLRAFLIPLVLALTFVGYITLVDVLGRPFPGFPPDQSRLIHYAVGIETTDYNKRIKNIIMWVYTEGDHRLYKVPYSRKLEEALIAEDEDAKEGNPRKQIGAVTGAEEDGLPIRLYAIPWKDAQGKHSPPEEQ